MFGPSILLVRQGSIKFSNWLIFVEGIGEYGYGLYKVTIISMLCGPA